MAALLTPAELAALTPAERSLIARETERADWAATPLLDFIPRVNPRYWRPGHLAKMAALLERARRGERVRALVSAPPRHGKSELLLHAPAWWLAARPRDTVAYIAYAAQFAEGQSLKAREYAAATGFAAHPRRDALDEWRNRQMGGVVATGISGPTLGKGFHLLIVDDPHKDRVEAESPRLREKVYDYFKGTLLQRMEPGGAVIVTHQRWHDEDLIGRLADEGGWEYVNLEAVDSQTGAPLWPARYDLAELALLRAKNEYNWWSQYMGSPRPRGGAVFKREPARFEGTGKDGRSLLISVDAAGTESTRADYTVALCLAFAGAAETQTCNVVDMRRVQLEPQDAAKVLRDFAREHGNPPIYIEGSRDGKAQKRALELVDGALRLTDVPPIGDKFLRAQPVASAWNAESGSRIGVPADATAHPWVADFLAEHRLFTGHGDKHDDCVDALSQGWNVAAAPVEDLTARESHLTY